MTAQCEGMGEVGSARYEPALLPPCPSIKVLSYSNCQEIHSRQQTGLAVFPQICSANSSDGIQSVAKLSQVSCVCILPMPIVSCPAGSFQCKDLSCIHESKQCNNIEDCAHGEDEENCTYDCLNANCSVNCIWPKCQAGFFQCVSGGCVPADSVCDFEYNCVDGSDEAYCGDLLCPHHQLPCADGTPVSSPPAVMC